MAKTKIDITIIKKGAAANIPLFNPSVQEVRECELKHIVVIADGMADGSPSVMFGATSPKGHTAAIQCSAKLLKEIAKNIPDE